MTCSRGRNIFSYIYLWRKFHKTLGYTQIVLVSGSIAKGLILSSKRYSINQELVEQIPGIIIVNLYSNWLCTWKFWIFLWTLVYQKRQWLFSLNIRIMNQFYQCLLITGRIKLLKHIRSSLLDLSSPSPNPTFSWPQSDIEHNCIDPQFFS